MYASLNLFTKEFTILPYEAPTMKELIDKMEKLKLDWYFWKVKKQNFYPSLRNVIKIEDGSETFPWTPNYPVTEKDRLVDFDKSSDDYNILYFVDI